MTPTQAGQTSAATRTDAPLAAALATVRANITAFANAYPDDTTRGGTYPPRPATAEFPEGANRGWTTSFWPGMLWLAWELTDDDEFRAAASAHVPSFADRIDTQSDIDTHDLGFLYTLACVAPWRLVGDARGREAALTAADHLMARFLEPAGIIQAWGGLDDPAQRGRTIIDSLMNTPLLYWASEQTGDERYASAARRHTVQLRDHIIRPDGTTFHTFFWDPTTGAPLRGSTQQGYTDDSCWARGQAWGIYGFALNYRYARDESFLVAAQTCADYFLDHLPADGVAYWDLEFTDGDDQPRDSSAAAIAACGLAELATWLPDGERKDHYRDRAAAILDALATGYSTADHPESNALLLHGVYDWPSSVGVDEGTLWGDYFYLEALSRAVLPDRTLYW
jgi:unsaturated chondroitin disaccharide hydrolase